MMVFILGYCFVIYCYNIHFDCYHDLQLNAEELVVDLGPTWNHSRLSYWICFWGVYIYTYTNVSPMYMYI